MNKQKFIKEYARQTGEGIKIKAKKVVEFKISKAFKNQFNKKTK